ncbi:helix-turn-helix domain-containing protein [Paraglaciecola sp. 25GB23A]|uniref:helix-turn-helix domain-containing protein n=1 Tax=Paraglaciecola sp. 25GB23A TaxID=3156068 RepID=UPI0032AED3A7
MKVNTPADISPIIRDARKAKGWTQAKLAKNVGLFQKDISRIETTPDKVSLITLLSVCSALDIKLSATANNKSDLTLRKVLDF